MVRYLSNISWSNIFSLVINWGSLIIEHKIYCLVLNICSRITFALLSSTVYNLCDILNFPNPLITGMEYASKTLQFWYFSISPTPFIVLHVFIYFSVSDTYLSQLLLTNRFDVKTVLPQTVRYRLGLKSDLLIIIAVYPTLMNLIRFL